MKHLLRITSIVIGVAGAALGFISNAVDNKRQEIKIREEVDRRFEERFGKDDEDSQNDESEEES